MARPFTPRRGLLQAVLPCLESLECRRLFAASLVERGIAPGPKPVFNAAAAAHAPKKPAKPDLQASSDDGLRSNDNVTSVQTPVFDVDRASANMTVQLLRDGVVVASFFTASGGTVSLRDSGPITPGVHQYTARQVNSVGVVSDESPVLTVTFATSVMPPPAPAMPDLQAGSDSGRLDTDNLTRSFSPSFLITGVESGLIVRLLRDGVVVASGVAAWTTLMLEDATSPSDGTHSYTAVAVNSGGAGPASAGLSVTFDRTAPGSTSPDLPTSHDTGTFDDDDVTTATSLAFTIASLEADSTVELLRDGVVIATGSAGSDGTLSVDDSSMLADGSYAYAVRQTDAAGNASEFGAILDVTIDTTPPPAPAAPLLATTSDSGLAGDYVTRDLRPAFSVVGIQPGSIVQLLEGDVVIGSAVAAGTPVLVQPTSLLLPGTHSFSLRLIDAAGNVGPSGATTSVMLLNALASSDFDGDGVSDPAVYNAGTWQILQSTGGLRTELLGVGSDVPVAGDYDGDGRTDIAVYRPGSRVFIIVPSSTPDATRFQFIATANQIPVPADYDGDGKTDVAIFNYSTGVFTIARSTGGTITRTIGPISGAYPAAGDFDGDGKADCAVFDPATATWTVARSTGGTITQPFGTPGVDQPFVGDFDGDGFDDLVVYDSSGAEFDAMLSSGGLVTQIVSNAADIPMAGDFDGDGRFDFAGFARSSATFTILCSTEGLRTASLGSPGGLDQPLPLSIALVRFDVLGF